MQPFLEGDKSALVLTFAIPDHPWVDSGDGAAVRIAMTVGERRGKGTANGSLLTVKSESVPVGDDAAEVVFKEEQGRILTDLTIGAELDSINLLKSNDGLANRGVSLFGLGFVITREKAQELGLGKLTDLEKYIRHYRHGRDLTDRSRDAMVIDLFGLSLKDVFDSYPSVYQHVLETVKPERDQNNRPSRRDNWWIFGETNPKLRKMLQGLKRYIVTVETSKHRFFQFLEIEILPDNRLVNFALDNAYHLGILSSKIHVLWSLAAGGTLEDRPVYNKTRCFDPFPFPAATPEQQTRICELAEQLDAHRKRQQAANPTLTLTDLYNVVEKLRAGESLSAKDQIVNQQGLASVVLSLHQQIDAAVSDAYGWPDGLPDSEILTRLVQLNHERAAEEAAGQIRYLRPSYQAPGQQQLGLDLPTTVRTPTAAPVTAQQEWPKELAQQMQTVRDVVQQAGVPLSTKQVAAFFQKTPPGKVQPLLDTLAALALLRQTADGAYAI